MTYIGVYVGKKSVRKGKKLIKFEGDRELKCRSSFILLFCRMLLWLVTMNSLFDVLKYS